MIESTAGDEKKSENEPNSLLQVQLTDLCISTSGTYRSGHYHEGKWFGHVLDARTGYPIPRERHMASVVAKSAVEADGWATALLTLDEQESKEIASFLSYETDSGLKQWRSELGNMHFQITSHGSISAPRLKPSSAKWPFFATCLIALILIMLFLAKRLGHH
jgi:hypothetical protein